jgi:hypothetical protein
VKVYLTPDMEWYPVAEAHASAREAPFTGPYVREVPDEVFDRWKAVFVEFETVQEEMFAVIDGGDKK